MEYGRLLECSITSSEESPYFQCEMTLLDDKDYRKFKMDEPFSLFFMDIEYQMIVDGRSYQRSYDDDGNLNVSVTISGLSPLCLFAEPRAKPITKTWETPVMASAVVEEMLGEVDWQMGLDWLIPAFRLSAQSSSPLDVAKLVVEAAGGLIESLPDGTVVCRPRWPMSIAHLQSYTLLDESIIFSYSENPLQNKLVDKVRIYDVLPTYQDKLEFVANENDKLKGMVYGYLSPWRDGLWIASTRFLSYVTLGEQKVSTRIEKETVTFEELEGHTQYPIAQLNSVKWMDQDLGGVVYEPYTSQLRATQKADYIGYSLAEIEYVTKFIEVPVECLIKKQLTEAQFLLLENADGRLK